MRPIYYRSIFVLVALSVACGVPSRPDSIGSETFYTVHVTYAPLPPITELEHEFSGKGSVSSIFDGRPFENHASCTGINRISGQREMMVKSFGREITSEEAIAEMDEKGYRPATHFEARDFAKAHPELQREFSIAAMGSAALYDGDRCVAILDSSGNGRTFGYGWFYHGWPAHFRFLFVRK